MKPKPDEDARSSIWRIWTRLPHTTSLFGTMLETYAQPTSYVLPLCSVMLLLPVFIYPYLIRQAIVADGDAVSLATGGGFVRQWSNFSRYPTRTADKLIICALVVRGEQGLYRTLCTSSSPGVHQRAARFKATLEERR